MHHRIYISIIVFICSFQSLSSQNNQEKEVTTGTTIEDSRQEMKIQVSILDKETRNAIKDAEIKINGKSFLYSDTAGGYIVNAKIGDELRVVHSELETIYYTITSNDKIKFLVEGLDDYGSNTYLYSVSKSKSRKVAPSQYPMFIDSAKFYKEKDIEKSVSFIEESLKEKPSKKQNGASYKLLADVYLYWQQYDLAVNNYKLSLQIYNDESTKLQLAHAYFLLKDFSASEKLYNAIKSRKLSKYEKILLEEGLGDIAFILKKYNGAQIYYNEALKLAKRYNVTAKVTDLNSKLGEVYAAKGNVARARAVFNNSLKLAEKESKNRFLQEQEKVANFLNSKNLFDDEIRLRKNSLEDVKKRKDSVVRDSAYALKKALGIGMKELTIDRSSLGELSTISSQRINYKIGTAYIQKEDYKEAIPFLEKSVSDANDDNDLIVEKDATRRLSEVYASVGEYSKALKSYQEYVQLVDKLYIQKEQEIQQAKRFGRKISDNQNRIASLEKDKELSESKISLAYIDQRLSEESNRRQRLIIYSLLAGVLSLIFLAYLLFRNNKQQKLANNLLALKSMRSQMNPHFIFNALNSVNSFIAVNDERNANRYLSEFSVLMRSVLENSDEDFIPITKEIELLELYVKLEHNRFRDKFDYKISVDTDIELSEFAIPPMLLQPYIENAIWHGLRYKEEKGNLGISIQRKGEDSVLITIIDDGIGRKKSQELKTKNQLKRKSKGMSTIESRIAILNDMYQDRISVGVTDVFKNGEGTKVVLILKKK